ncbi:hypothetical protein PoB_002891700 [Plakobranchus ocellatus]|uniref:Uncharacterized protein n=1 Tax=Plakobranchus ocellatus TaxID=259542 RepID=A0AAV4A6E6_9GAST|nr:hypothetical protein PoB_002891700 [Plakobranchus ocellatus]
MTLPSQILGIKTTLGDSGLGKSPGIEVETKEITSSFRNDSETPSTHRNHCREPTVIQIIFHFFQQLLYLSYTSRFICSFFQQLWYLSYTSRFICRFFQQLWYLPYTSRFICRFFQQLRYLSYTSRFICRSFNSCGTCLTLHVSSAVLSTAVVPVLHIYADIA